MKICASLSSPEDLHHPETAASDSSDSGIRDPDTLNPDTLNSDTLNPDTLNPDILNPDILNSDMIEIRTDLFEKSGSPFRLSEFLSELNRYGFSQDRILITLRGKTHFPDDIPENFSGFIDSDEDIFPFSRAGKFRRISSYHDFEKTPPADEICRILEKACQNSDISKGAFAVRTLADLRSIADASLSLTRRKHDISAVPHILIGMGPLGTVTRIRSALLGNEFTFASAGQPTAPGQLSVTEMKESGDDCLITGLLGHPVSRSASPAMHRAAFASSGIPGKYLLFDTPSADDLVNLPDVMRFYRIGGLNVTIPYKTAVIPYLDTLDEAASKIGAVNTIINTGGKLTGANTDHIGIRTAFEKAGVSLSGRSVLVYGSGGAARACLYLFSLCSGKGTTVTVAGRNEKTVRQVASDFKAVPLILPGRDTGNAGSVSSVSSDSSVSSISPVSPGSVSLRPFDIIVNATPVGMSDVAASGNSPGTPAGNSPENIYPFDLSELRPSHIVFDMVYHKKTPLVAAAENAGCTIVSGKDMLAGQGAASFEYWTGLKTGFEIMRQEIS